MLRTILSTAFLFFSTSAFAQYAPENDEALALAQAGDMQAAWDIWKPLADAGDARAQANIGTILDKGDLVEEDDVEAVWWFRLSAEGGFAAGQYNLGIMYHRGTGVAQDYTQSFHWFRLSARQGWPWSQTAVARAYLNGLGVAQDSARSYMWLALAAENKPELVGDFLEQMETRVGKAAIVRGRMLLAECHDLGVENCE